MNKTINKLSYIAIIIILVSCATANKTATNKQNKSNAAPVILNPKVSNKQSASNTAEDIINDINEEESDINNNQSKPRIKEKRVNGEVTQIKVRNKILPTYYIDPSQQPDSNGRNTVDTSISTPSWKISW